MTKKEFIEKLEELNVPDDANIFVYDVGDLEILTYDEGGNELKINR